MTFSRILSAAAGVMSGSGSTTTTTGGPPATTLLEAAAADYVQRQYYLPQNPYVDYGDEHFGPSVLDNKQRMSRRQYGMADSTGHGGSPHQNYGPPSAGTGGGSGYYPQHTYQQQPVYQAQPMYHHHHVAPAPIIHPRVHKSSKSNSSAMSALTLLAFLFFLNILQSCLKEHMMTMNPTVMVMTAGAARIRIPNNRAKIDDTSKLHQRHDDDVGDDDDHGNRKNDDHDNSDAEMLTLPMGAAAALATAQNKRDYNIFIPDVDAKMFGDEFDVAAQSQQQRKPQQERSASYGGRSNRTIAAKLQRDALFGKITRLT